MVIQGFAVGRIFSLEHRVVADYDGRSGFRGRIGKVNGLQGDGWKDNRFAVGDTKKLSAYGGEA